MPPKRKKNSQPPVKKDELISILISSEDDDVSDGLQNKRKRSEDALLDLPEDVLAVVRSMGEEWQPKQLRSKKEKNAPTSSGVPRNYYYCDVELEVNDEQSMFGVPAEEPSSKQFVPLSIDTASEPEDNPLQLLEAARLVESQDIDALRAQLQQAIDQNIRLLEVNTKLKAHCSDSDAFGAQLSEENLKLKEDRDEMLSTNTVQQLQMATMEEELTELRTKVDEMTESVKAAGLELKAATDSATTHRLKSCLLDHLLGKGTVKGHISLPKDCHIVGMNPCLVSGWVFEAFTAGCAQLGFNSIQEAIEQDAVKVGFHGTPAMQNVTTIFCDGFDPSRRNGQRYGVGEYFDQDMSECWGFAKGCAVIVTLVLKKAPRPPQPTPQNWIVVTNPPREEGITYCYPAMALCSGKHSPGPIPRCPKCAKN